MPVELALNWVKADEPFTTKPDSENTQYIPNVTDWEVSAYMTHLTVEQDGKRRVVSLRRNGHEVYDIKSKAEDN